MVAPLLNHPDLWREDIPPFTADAHKYDRGSALIIAAPELTGATRLAASACLYSGVGLTTIFSQDKANIFRTMSEPDIMVVENDASLTRDKITACLIGPGGLPDHDLPDLDMPYVLDAAAISHFKAIGFPKPSILTPHDGEFAKACPEFKGSRLETIIAAAKTTGTTIIRKGPETIIAAPDGRVILNTHASPALAKGGTGDVLAGLVTGLIAQGMPIFQACACAVWLHGEAGRQLGPYLIASELPPTIRDVLRVLSA